MILLHGIFSHSIFLSDVIFVVGALAREKHFFEWYELGHAP